MQLTKRAKLAETRYDELVKSLDLPDLSVVFSSIIIDKKTIEDNKKTIEDNKKTIEDLQEELKKVKMENDDLEKEFKFLKNQEITVRRLEEENKLMNAKMESKLASSMDTIRSELAQNYEQQIAKCLQREIDLQEQVAQHQSNYNALQLAYTDLSSKMLEVSQKHHVYLYWVCFNIQG